MKNRTVRRMIKSTDSLEGAGVQLKRSIGQRNTNRIDPFLLLDYFYSDDASEYIAGFPTHPHRGFETVTYMIEGVMSYRDQYGFYDQVNPGGVQWIKTGKGVIHDEKPKHEMGKLRGFQFWINSHSSEKMSMPTYQNIDAKKVTVVDDEQKTLRLIAGSIVESGEVLEGPIQGGFTKPLFIDVEIKKNQEYVLTLESFLSSFVYLFEGSASIQDQALGLDAAHELSAGDLITIKAGDRGARLIIMAAKPLNEPVVQYGPFVMNTVQEIEEALQAYRNGTLTSHSKLYEFAS